jgi:transposase-like protein
MKYRRYSREEKDALMVEWQTAGRSRSAFAQQHGLNTQTFINWTKENRTAEQKFVELPVRENTDTGERRLTVEKGSIRIILPLHTETAELSRIIGILAGI